MSFCFYNLQGVKDDDGRDLIDEAISDDYSYKSKVTSILWAQYRYAILNNTDVDRWVQFATDRATLLNNRYSLLFAAYEAFKTSGDLTSIQMKDSRADSRTITDTGTGTSSGTVTTTDSTDTDSTDVVTNEDIPATSGSSASNWLTSRTRDTFDGTVSENGTQTSSSSDNSSNNRTDDGTTTLTYMDGAIPPELIDRMKRNLFDPYLEYAREFNDLFVPFYTNDICGCWI